MTRTGRLAKSSGTHGDRRSFLRISALAFVFLALVPAVSFAQSGIAGIVKDSSGAVLPGVTVEATSSVLIEKVRTAITDDQGRYNIVDLRPGTYTVTFTLTGFNTVKREGIDLPSSFTATVNADLPVGALEETVTVSGQAPVVDLQNAAQKRTLSRELLEGVPTSRLPQGYAVLIPGTVASGPAYAGALQNTFVQQNLTWHGIGSSQFMTEGFDHSHSGTGGGQYTINQGTVQELVVSTGGAGADQASGGIVTNVIPKDGSNRLSGQMYFHYTDEHFLGDNLTPELAAVVPASQSVRKQSDINPSVGGPLKRDKLWFFGSYRHSVGVADAAVRFDLDPLDYRYTPDLSRKTASEKMIDRNTSLRLTWQVTPRNKVSAYFDNQPKDWFNRLIAPTTAPEASHWGPYLPNYLAQLIWKSPLTSRLLLEAGTSYQNIQLNMYPNTREPTFGGPVSPDLFAVSAIDLDIGMTFRGSEARGNGLGIFNHTRSLRSRAAAAYVTGSHAFKTGVDVNLMNYATDKQRPGDYSVTLRSGVPVSITLWGREHYANTQSPDLGLYVQDQWTLKRLTANLGLRYDYNRQSNDATDVPTNRWLPARHFDARPGVVGLHDLSPRLGVTYDLFGNGKTALKATLNRYVALLGVGLATNVNPVVTSVVSANRNWNDSFFPVGDPRRGNFLPDCDFSNPAANNECGVLSNLNFGLRNPRATTYDPALLYGFGNRDYNWETSATVQHELVTGLGVSAAYFRRWFGNFTAVDNTLVAPSDFDRYCITAPVDSRLPGGGGNQLCGFYDVSPTKVGQTQNFVTFASNFGELRQVYTGVEFSVNARLAGGAQVTGGTSTGRVASNTCVVVDSPQALQFCDVKPLFQTQLKLMGVYPLPWYGVQVSAAFQRVPGPEISTTDYVAANAEIRTTLGRNLASGANGTVTLPLMQPGTVYADSFSKIDVRLTKIFRIGRSRITGSLDIFNALNGAGVVQVNTRYGRNWLNPTKILGARLFRFSAQLDF